ncbi:MAG: gamma-glutamylcyclotransferase family protein, partial [Pseudomonadota bacterium]
MLPSLQPVRVALTNGIREYPAAMISYFAYGSNMSLARLRGRVPTARLIDVAVLSAHSLRFHKSSPDGSGKCDAFHTGNPGDRVMGGIFAVHPDEKPVLDEAESLGVGYDEKRVAVQTLGGEVVEVSTYYALR